MYLEHLVYSCAIAVLVGMVYSRWQGRDPSWIIIVSAYAPDIDKIFEFGFGIILVSRSPWVHEILHSVGALIIFSLVVGIFLLSFKSPFWETVFFAGFGYSVHLFLDALVYDPAYPFFWPFSSTIYSIGLIEYTRDFFGIGNMTVLVIGMILLGLVIAIRTAYEGKSWLGNYLPNGFTVVTDVQK